MIEFVFKQLKILRTVIKIPFDIQRVNMPLLEKANEAPNTVTWKWQNLLTSKIGVGGVGINNEDVQLERKLDHLLNKLIWWNEYFCFENTKYEHRMQIYLFIHLQKRSTWNESVLSKSYLHRSLSMTCINQHHFLSQWWMNGMEIHLQYIWDKNKVYNFLKISILGKMGLLWLIRKIHWRH